MLRPLGLTGFALAWLVISIVLVGCSGDDDRAESTRSKGSATTPATDVRVRSGPRAVRLREAIITGARRDFATATASPPGFERCFENGFRGDLTVETLQRLVAIERSAGEASAAQALNRVGVPAADRCGGREHVPELSTAAADLGSAVRGLSPDPVPAPRRFVAPEVPVTKCKAPAVVGGYDVRVAGMSCADADEILNSFTTAFSDRNLAKELVERGHGWRCYQRIFGGGFSVEETCWRGHDQVVIFKK